MSRVTGESFEAKFDGKEYPYKGNPSISTVSLTMVGARSIDETDKHDGKVVAVYHLWVSDDGRGLFEKVEDKESGTTTMLTFIKL
jgi:Iap family predicted aminopeptidase